MSLEEYSLWDSRVLYSALDDVDGVIIKVVVKNALADSVVLIRVFNNWFLEVDFEIKYLKKESVTLAINVLKHSADFAYNK